ncbi:MAG: hypothetical protein FJ044_02960 [Candidatus Cloacimonetes bacterium]|nr:hypothetical protein [Candidatus Cloacimonadota bacterium]
MSLFKQALIVFALLQLLFGYFEYQYKPDLLYILGRLINRKYLIPSLTVPIAYVFLVLILGYLLKAR